jgi:hypothetical protein
VTVQITTFVNNKLDRKAGDRFDPVDEIGCLRIDGTLAESEGLRITAILSCAPEILQRCAAPT